MVHSIKGASKARTVSPTEAIIRRFAGWLKDGQLSSLPWSRFDMIKIKIWVAMHSRNYSEKNIACGSLFANNCCLTSWGTKLQHAALRWTGSFYSQITEWTPFGPYYCFPSSLHMIDDRKENHVRFIIIVLILLQFKVVYTYTDHPNDAYATSWVCDWVLFHLVGHNQHIQPHL